MCHVFCNVYSIIQKIGKTAVVLAIEAISEHPNLWFCYFSDFMVHKMKLETSDDGGGIARKILEAYFDQKHNQDALLRMVTLHTYTHVYHLTFAQMADALRSLNKIQNVKFTF